MTHLEEKPCCECGVVKATSHFNKSSNHNDGLQAICRDCAAEREKSRPKRSWTKEAIAERQAAAEAKRAAQPSKAEKQRAFRERNPEKIQRYRAEQRARGYGLTHAHIETRFAEQNGQCAICLVDIDVRKAHVDHDHFNDKLRALLCGDCNVGLGYFMDNPAFMRRAADYIDFWSIVHQEETEDA